MRIVPGRLSAILSLVLAVLALSTPPAGAIGASATIDAKELLKLRGCGREKGSVAAQLLLEDDGGWSLTAGALTLGGTYVAGGRGDRKLTLTLGGRRPAAGVSRGPADDAVW